MPHFDYYVICAFSLIWLAYNSFSLWTPLGLVTLSSYPTYCTMLGLLDQFWTPVVRVSPLKTPSGLLIPLFTIPVTCHYNHTQLSITRLRVYTIIITYTLVTKVTYNTLTRLYWLTSQLSVTFTNYHRLYIFTLPVSVSYRDLTRRADFQRLTPVEWALCYDRRSVGQSVLV
jgi:hypothetical protein